MPRSKNMTSSPMAPSSSSSSSTPTGGVMTRSRVATSTVKKPSAAAVKNGPNSNKKDNNVKKSRSNSRNSSSSKGAAKIDYVGYAVLLILIVITIVTYPRDKVSRVTWQQVWYYGWITAVSTGLGALPFCFFSDPNKFWMGVSNALAGGMMIAASYSLAYEGSTFTEAKGLSVSPLVAMGAGFVGGIVFIVITKQVLDQFEDLKTEIDGASAQKMVLIVFVMTLHSLTEGIGIGVSFGGKSGMQLGQFISLSLAVHNVPEGLAVALVMTTRKVSQLRAALWAVLTSLPQPMMAVPAFIFVEKFIDVLPSGLGFAAGAMAYVAVFELLMEAVEDSGIPVAAAVSTVACGAMMVAQEYLK